MINGDISAKDYFRTMRMDGDRTFPTSYQETFGPDIGSNLEELFDKVVEAFAAIKFERIEVQVDYHYGSGRIQSFKSDYDENLARKVLVERIPYFLKIREPRANRYEEE